MSLSKNSMLLRACYLFYRENMNIQEIAEHIGISRFRVSRYIKEAQEKGIVQVQFHDPNIEYERIAFQLEQALSLKRAIVAPTPYEADMDSIRRAVGRAGADMFTELDPQATLGITWGRTMAYMVDNLPLDKLHAKRVVDLAGGFGRITSDLSAHTVTVRTAEKLRAECVQLPAPIIADSPLSAQSLLAESSIRKTLNIATQSAISIMGVGPIDRDSLYHRSGYLSSDDLRYLKEIGAVGSILGRFFDQDGKECNTEYRDRAIALTFSEFLQIPERIVLAAGKSKVPSILGLVRGGLITTLVIDSETAIATLDAYKLLQESEVSGAE